MTQRLNVVTSDEWKRLRAALPRVLKAKSFGTDEYRESTRTRIETILDVLWATGCHPSVLADPKRHSIVVKNDGLAEYSMTWRRPKKKGLAGYCAMPISDELAERLDAYIAGETFSRKTIWQYVAECANEAGVHDVTPRTLRHTVGFRIFKALGPSAAKESLNVSDRVLQYYLAMDSETRIKAIRELNREEPR